MVGAFQSLKYTAVGEPQKTLGITLNDFLSPIHHQDFIVCLIITT